MVLRHYNNPLRDYKEYSGEIIVISKFEDYEVEVNVDYGELWEDFGDHYLLFRAGFLAGGNS